MSIDGLEPAQLAAPGQINRESKIGQAAPLCAGLEDAAGAADRLGQREALGDVLGAGFFAVNVLAGVGREDGGGDVPVGPGGDEDGLDIAAGQQLAQVAVRGAVVVAVFGISPPLDRRAARFLDIAHGHELHVGFLEETAQVVGAPVADADAAQDDAFAGGDAAVPAQNGSAHHLGRGQQGAGLECGLEKPPAAEAGARVTRGWVEVGGTFGS